MIEIKYTRCLQAVYNKLQSRSPDELYYCKDTGNCYLGDLCLFEGDAFTAVSLEGTVITFATHGASGIAGSKTLDISPVLSGKADKVSGATVGNFAALNETGNIADSGKKPSDFATSEQGAKADTAVQSVAIGNTTTGNAGTNASVTNSGTQTNPVFDFTIPRGEDAVNPFKGWFDSSSDLPSNPSKGDYAYVHDASPYTTVSIWRCATAGTWADSGDDIDTSNVSTFETGEALNQVSIIDGIEDGGGEDVFSAKQGVFLGQMLRGVTFQHVKSTASEQNYHVNGSTGALGTNSSFKHIKVNCSGYRRVRFRAQTVSSGTTMGYAFWGDADNVVEHSVFPLKTGDSVERIELIVDVPTAAKYFLTTSNGTALLSDFYCYLEKGDTVSEMIPQADETKLSNAAEGTFAKAADVQLMKQMLNGLTFEETAPQFTPTANRKVQGDGTISSSDNTVYSWMEVPLADCKKVRFLGIKFSSSDTATTKNTGYALVHYVNGTEVIDFASPFDTNTDSSRVNVEYMLDVSNYPNATHFRTTCKGLGMTSKNFYCYLQIGETVKELIPTVIDNLESDDSENALSAKQGKEIASIIIIEKESIVNGTIRNKYIYEPDYETPSRRNKAYNGTARSHYRPDISAYTGKTIRIKANPSRLTRFCFLTEWVNPTDQNPLVDPAWATGYDSVVTVKTGKHKDVVVPEDAVLLYLEVDKDGNYPPSVVVVESIGTIVEQDHNFIENINAATIPAWTVELQYSSEYWYIKHSNAQSNRNKWAETNKYSHALIPVNPGDLFKFTASDNRSSAYAFLTGNYKASTKAPHWATGYSSVVEVDQGTSVNITAPDDANYLYIETVFNNVSSAPKSLKKAASTQDAIDSIQETLDNFSPSEGTGIFDFNPDSEVRLRLESMLKSVRHSVSTGSYTRLSSDAIAFGHISDCHGSGEEGSKSNKTWLRAIEFFEHWKKLGFIRDIVDTGDVVNANYNDSIGWRTVSDDVLTIIGNHDTSIANGSGAERWLPKVGLKSYEKYIGPNIGNWEVIQPQNAASEGKCYYHKDYTTNTGFNSSVYDTQSTMTMRAIFLDVMGFGYGVSVDTPSDAQKAWLEERLSEALSTNYKVVIFCHYPPIEYVRLACSYSSLSRGTVLKPSSNAGASIDYNSKYAIVGKMVHDFQVAGGTFLGYVCGHVHYECIGKVAGKWNFTNELNPVQTTSSGENIVDFDDEAYPQMVFAAGKGNVGLVDNMSDYQMIADTKTNDNFQLISFQLYNNVARLAKIGCNIDNWMRKKDVASVRCGAIKPFSVSNYLDGNYCTHNNVIYKILITSASGTNFEESSKDEIEYNENYSTFNPNTLYKSGKKVNYNGQSYLLTKVVASSVDWEATVKEPARRIMSD